MIHKRSSQRTAIQSLLMVVLGATLLSFTPEPGGDTFTIYLNDKLLVRQLVLHDAGLPTITLKASSPDDILKVHYNHCGKTGIKRSMTILDGNKKVLKTWDYPDSAPPVLNLAVKEFISLKNVAAQQGLQLVYASREIPKGMVLASIVLMDDSKANAR